jgi:lysophospholipase L1-like esterase
MLKEAHIYRRIIVPIILVISLLFAFTSVTLVAAHGQGPPLHLFGPKQHYLALGDSLAFGQQPNCVPPQVPVPDCTHGYVNDLFQVFQSEGTKDFKNLGCPGESSITFINGGCLGAPPFPYTQLGAAVKYLQDNAGKVSPVTLDIGANDMLPDLSGCTPLSSFPTDLATLDSNLTGTILPELLSALTVKGRVTGSIVMMNYYNPFPNCLANQQFVQDFNTFNTHLANDVSGFGFIVDVFGAFGGITTPNICTYTWICSSFHDIHPTDLGYNVIANTFAAAIPPD